MLHGFDLAREKVVGVRNEGKAFWLAREAAT
jgi:hypothetical protein